MTNNNPNPKFAPAAYQQHFTTAEFRFRWMDALVEVEDKWFKSSVAHLARALGSYMDRSGECWPAVSTLAHAMRVDQRTVRRALSALVEYGWLIAVMRPGNTSLYQAVLPEYGLELLLRSREKKADLPTAADWQEATYRVLDSACAAFGISRCDWAGTKEWARVEGRTRQIIQRLGGPAADTEYLIKALTHEPPVNGVREPVAFLLKRLSNVSLQICGASGKRKTARIAPTDDVARLVADIITNQKAKLKTLVGGVALRSDCSQAWPEPSDEDEHDE